MHYGDEKSRQIGLRFNIPERLSDEASRRVEKGTRQNHRVPLGSHQVLRALQKLGEDVTIYPDSQTFIDHRLLPITPRRKVMRYERIQEPSPSNETSEGRVADVPSDWIASAVGAGRCILVDDMGLGKRSGDLERLNCWPRYWNKKCHGGFAPLLSKVNGSGDCLFLPSRSANRCWGRRETDALGPRPRAFRRSRTTNKSPEMNCQTNSWSYRSKCEP